MRSLLITILLLFLMAVGQYFCGIVLGENALPSGVALGFLLLVAYFSGHWINGLNLPFLTGYILMGVLCGPYALHFLSGESVQSLKLIDEVAILLIAITAGGEIRLDALRRNGRAYTLLVLFISLSTFLGAVALLWVFRAQVLVHLGNDQGLFWAVALLIGITCVAKSPAATIAIINECRARGPLTEMALNVVVLLDLVVIVGFTVIAAATPLIVGQDSSFAWGDLMHLGREIPGALVVGAVAGFLVALYLNYVRTNLLLFCLRPDSCLGGTCPLPRC